MQKYNAFIILLIPVVLTFCLCGCQSGDAIESKNNPDANKYEVEYSSLFFDSFDQLCQAIKEYPELHGVNDQRLYAENNFGNLTIDYYPKMTDQSFSLLTIEVNKYNIFYYYTPLGSNSFSYSDGIVVTVPREKEATMESIKNQFPSALEINDSLFVNEIHSWFIPIGCSYYEISYPASVLNCDKSIIEMIPIDCVNNTQ